MSDSVSIPKERSPKETLSCLVRNLEFYIKLNLDIDKIQSGTSTFKTIEAHRPLHPEHIKRFKELALEALDDLKKELESRGLIFDSS